MSPDQNGTTSPDGDDRWGALRVGPTLLAQGATSGPLAGTTFVAKDLFDVTGHATGAGNPERLGLEFVASSHASSVQGLLDAGASLIGKAHTDELAYSLMGVNVHYPPPGNPRAPGRLVGGSSSGSASAVASGLADFALGTDTGGSVRIPASYCGIYGIRPTHGRVAASGVVPLAPSFDTVGWFADEPRLLQRVGDVLLPTQPATHLPSGWPAAVAIPLDVLSVAGASAQEAVRAAASVLCDRIGVPCVEIVLIEESLADCSAAFTSIQGHEAWASHGSWVSDRSPTLGEGTRARLEAGAAVTATDLRRAQEVAASVRRQVAAATANTVLLLPGAVGPPPSVDVPDDEAAALRTRLLQITSPVGLAGAPAVAMPWTRTPEGPIGVAMVGPRGSDEHLLALVAQM